MNLISKFENMPEQTVKTFNKLFKSTPIVGFNSNDEVRIGEVSTGNERKVYIGESVLSIDLTQNKKVKSNKKIVKKSTKKLEKMVKKDLNLPSIYKILTPTEFMVYSAIREAGEVDGIEELSEQLSIINKTIYTNLKRLTALGLVKSRMVADNSGRFNKLTIDTSVKL